MPAADVSLCAAPVTMARREPGAGASARGREGGGVPNQCLTLTSNNWPVGAISPFQISPGHGLRAPFGEQRFISSLELGRGAEFPIPLPHAAQRSAGLISARPRSSAAGSLGLLFSVPLMVSFLLVSVLLLVLWFLMECPSARGPLLSTQLFLLFFSFESFPTTNFPFLSVASW